MYSFLTPFHDSEKEKKNAFKSSQNKTDFWKTQNRAITQFVTE